MKDEQLKSLLRRFTGEAFRADCREGVYALLNSLSLALAPKPSSLCDGVALWGMLDESSGMGQCARSMAAALEQTSLPFALRPLRSGAGGDGDYSPFDYALSEKREMGINLFCANADCTGYFLRQSGAKVLKGRKNIALWAWELPEFPSRWSSAFRWYDEIWTISQYCQSSISRATEKSVKCLPLCVDPHKEQGLTRRDFGLPEDTLLFLSMYDARSIQKRKNPLGALHTYCSAFPEGSGTALVLKVGGGLQGRKEAQILRTYAQRSDIYIIEDVLSKPRLYALMELCDVFISLHRAEGFGYPVAEAMALGKAVVVTGWSGNMDYCHKDNACCIDYTLRPLGKDATAPYDAHQLWAEPDVDCATQALQRLKEDASYRKLLGANAQREIALRYSPKVCATALMEALEKE